MRSACHRTARTTRGSCQLSGSPGSERARLDDPGLSRLRSTELSLLLQEPLQNLIPYATAGENVTFAQRGSRRRHWPVRWTARELVDIFALGTVSERPVYELSAGEQQRAALAAAISTSPRVLVADEPTTSLDEAARNGVIEALKRAHELSGATVIVATHDPLTAAAFPRTVTISHGVIGSEGRGGERFARLGRDGAVQLPPEVATRFPVESLFRVVITETGVELRPESPPEPPE